MTGPESMLSIDVRVHGSGRRSLEVAVAFDVPPGVTVLFGPSGSGKSTVLSAIAGILRPDAGRIALAGERWFDAEARIDVPPHARRLSLVFQSLALFPHMTAAENVAYGLDQSLSRDARRSLAVDVLARMDAAHVADQRPATLSGGEAQRVALARAFARGPRVLLLDEPLTALDLPLRARLLHEVRRFVDEHRLPAIYVTHDVGEAMVIADQAVRLDAGRVVGAGSPLDVLPHHPAD